MGYAPFNHPVSGQFKEKDFGNHFEFIEEVDDWGRAIGATHTVYVGHDQVRYARILKTVAYICVDEDENCQPVWEKWNIKTLWRDN